MLSSSRKDARLSLKELVIYGFNFTIAVNFIFAFHGFFNNDINHTHQDHYDNLGLHMLWIFAVNGLIACIIAWAYARLLRVHIKEDGGSYVFVRSHSSFFLSWMIGALLYLFLMMTVTSQIVSALRINFGFGSRPFGVHWGSFSNLVLDLLATLIFLSATCLLFLGLKKFKRFFMISVWIKWVLILTLVLIIMIVLLMNLHRGDHIWSDFTNHTRSTINFKSFSTNFMEVFYFFTGVETYATLNKNLKNPRQDLPVGIFLVIFITVIFYILVMLGFIGTLTKTHPQFEANPIFEIFHQLFSHTQWLYYFFSLLMIVCFLVMQLLGIMEGALYTNSIILPMVADDYLPAILAKNKQHNIANNTVKFYIVTTLTMYFLVVILVDIYQGVTGAIASPLDYGEIIGLASLIIIPVYVMVLYITLKLSFNKKITSNLFEKTIWITALVFLLLQVMWYFYSLLMNFIQGGHVAFVAGLELGLLIVILSTLTLFYFCYFHRRLQVNPVRAQQLRNKYCWYDE